MTPKRLFAVYFSATGTTRQVLLSVAQWVGEGLHLDPILLDITRPAARKRQYTFTPDDLILFGMPVYAGRLPNLLLPFLKGGFTGGGALAVPVVLYGNRNFDDALVELRDLLEADGFHTIGAAAFVGEHSFSRTLGAGRPDAADLNTAHLFANALVQRITALESPPAPVPVAGQQPIRPYYTPRDRNGCPIDIRKVKPKTSDACNGCGQCAALCPMGAIPESDPRQVTGICIKCGACVKGCPQNAKYYDDANYLYHKTELEEVYTRRAPVRLFLDIATPAAFAPEGETLV